MSEIPGIDSLLFYFDLCLVQKNSHNFLNQSDAKYPAPQEICSSY